MESHSRDFHIEQPDFLKVISKDWTNDLSVSRVRVVSLRQLAEEQVKGVLTKRYDQYSSQFKKLYFQFQLRNKQHKWRITKTLDAFLQLQKQLKRKNYPIRVRIPIQHQNDLKPQHYGNALQILEIFMQNLIKNKEISLDIIFRIFIQNMVPSQMTKLKVYKHMQIKKKAGGRFADTKFKKFVQAFSSWSSRFITISSEGIFYTSAPQSDKIEEFISFTPDFKVQYAQQKAQKFQIIISSSQRILTLDAENLLKMVIFIYFLNKALADCNCYNDHRFKSFAGVREKCQAEYFVDGKDYFSSMYDQLLKAQKQVFMTGWWISPQFCLKRPDPQQQSRLDRVLDKIAKKGVKISIIVYMQPTVALNIDSLYTQKCLSQISDNIKVLRHPAYLLIPFLWSHHQKMVVIDQKIAFMGGLDICFGRMDDQRHLLTDQNQQLWPGVDYCNYRKTDILKPRNFQQCSIDRKNEPRMPWHDITIKLVGSVVTDLSRHFVQYWNYVNFQLDMDQRELLLYAGYTQNSQENQKSQRRTSIFVMDPIQHKAKFESQISTEEKQHEQAFFNLHRQSKIPNQELMFYSSHIQEIGSVQKLQNMIKKMNVFSNRHAFNASQFVVAQPTQTQFKQGLQTCQILRSASMWGIGLQQGMQQSSIHQAYIDLILNSKNFIYIENQFFISVQNSISKFIKERIRRAYKNNQKFRMIVVLPFIAGFEGQPEESALLRVQLDLMYSTICRGQKSIVEELNNQIGHLNVDKYIRFYCLRTHAVLNQKPVTQIVYVHSKCMIVDDERVIIGSANINDRSLLGSRDSQLAVLIEDQEELEIPISQGVRKVKKFAHKLRTDLFMEHFGLSYDKVKDFLSDEFWDTIFKNAQVNQIVYSIVFGCYPSSKMTKFKDIKKLKSQSQIQKYEDLKGQIIGFACPFQMNFLEEEDLKIKAGTKQFLLPSINFT